MTKKIIIIASSVSERVADYQEQTIIELEKKNIVIFIPLLLSSRKGFFKSLFERKGYLLKEGKHFIFYPLNFFPLMRFTFIQQLNAKIDLLVIYFYFLVKKQATLQTKSILWIFAPYDFSVYVKLLTKVTHFSIYDCVDYFSGYKQVAEAEVIQCVDKIFVNSLVIQEKFKKQDVNSMLVPQGFRLSEFIHGKHNFHFPKDRPLIGFVGGFNTRIDFALLYKLIKGNPQWNFVLWGPIYEESKRTTDKFAKLYALPNIITGFSKSIEVKNIINQFDVGIIPYNTRLYFNKYCYPMKVHEFFYCGKPVISSEIEELKRFPEFVRICRNQNDWAKNISLSLSHQFSEKMRAESKKIALANSWQKKVFAIETVIESWL